MQERKKVVYPYMPNSVASIKQEMLNDLGMDSMDILLEQIPEELKFKGKMNLPEPILNEYDLKKHVNGILNKNTSCEEMISFLGAGCYNHYVPAICDEINSRAEFLTAYCGDTYSDHGKMQAIFEYTSLMGELLELDVVSYTTYDGAQAISSSLRMASRITNRKEIIVPKTMNPEVVSQLKDYGKKAIEITFVDYDPITGQIELNDLRKKISEKTAAVYFENPSYLGFIEEKGEEISQIAHEAGALCVVCADPSSLGVLETPANYGADIICGDIQPLGMHMNYGGGCAGFIASNSDDNFIQQYPTYFYGITTTDKEGEFGWGRALNYRTSHGSRENANEYFGTESGLWAITAGVYLSLMGPMGMKELGETIVQRCNYAKEKLSEVEGINTNVFKSTGFKEFIVNFDKTNMTVKQINEELLKYGIFGGKDLSEDFPQLGNSALYCVTEMTNAEDIQKLVEALKQIVQ